MRISEEQIIFIQILSDYIKGRDKSQVSSDTDAWVTYAHRHELEAILYKQTHMPELQKKYAYSLYDYQNRIKIIENIDTLFQSAYVDYFVVKGTELAKYYPNPALRQMGDSDIVVRDMEKAVSAIQSAGFEIQPDAYNEIHFKKAGIEFELHDQLFYEESINEEQLRVFFNDCWSYVHDNKLDENFHFIFTIAHLRKHFLWDGVGFRQFMDVALFSKQNLDWDWITKELDELKLLDFSRICFALIGRWFGITCPIEPAEITDEFYEEATLTIFENGVFGNGGHEIAMLTSEREKKSKVFMLVGRIFPSYNTMRKVKSYQFIDGSPWLLPIAWVYRWITAWRKGKDRISELYENDEAIASRQRKLKDWKV